MSYNLKIIKNLKGINSPYSRLSFLFLPIRMREKLKRVVAYIFRGWGDNEPPHSSLRILPPILFDILVVTILLGLLYQLGAYLWSLIN